MIPFVQTYISGNESKYLNEVIEIGHVSGNGKFSKLCQNLFKERYGFQRCLLTSSGTSALEMAALLLDIGPGDEVIMPSYTFSATANAFLLRGAKIIFCDSSSQNPNIDSESLEPLITENTKAIVIVHYAGISCEMEQILELCEKHKIKLVEDAAHAIDGFYNSKPLGSFGTLAAFSFHQTKNIVAGECGMLAINDSELINRAEILWENGTNRAAFHRGEVDKYTWTDIGSSFLASELSAAFLWAQLEELDTIQKRRVEIWNIYDNELSMINSLEERSTPQVTKKAQINGHIYYLVCSNENERNELISYLRAEGIYAVFHYNSLHKSPYFKKSYGGNELSNSDRYTQTLVRLPLFFNLSNDQVYYICDKIKSFFNLT